MMNTPCQSDNIELFMKTFASRYSVREATEHYRIFEIWSWITRLGTGNHEISEQLSVCRYLVNGKELLDLYGHPYGPRATKLEAAQFEALVGSIEMRFKNDEVEIATN